MPTKYRRQNDGAQSRDKQVSKKLSWLLRHGADKEGLQLGAGGYANLSDVLQSRTIRPLRVTMSELADIVSNNDKQRFSLIPALPNETVQSVAQHTMEKSTPTDVGALLSISDSSEPAKFLIRANQGHSIKVDNDSLLTKISTDDSRSMPEMIVHGTNRQAWQAIVLSGGLKPMTRNHVHFAAGLPVGTRFSLDDQNQDQDQDQDQEQAHKNGTTDVPSVQVPVISGMRVSSSILIFIELRKAHDLGLEFWRSDNGVILSDGGKERLIPLSCFKRVDELGKARKVLLRGGVVL